MASVIRPGFPYKYKGHEEYDEFGFVAGKYYQLKEIIGGFRAVFYCPNDGMEVDFPLRQFHEYWW